MSAEENAPQNRDVNRIFGLNPGSGFMIGGIMFMLLTNLSEAAVPGYNVSIDAISYLGGAGSPVEFFWNTQLFIVGILWIFSTFLLFKNKEHRILSYSFYLTGIGILLVSIDPWNVRGTLHGIGAQMGFFFGATSAIFSPRILNGGLRRLGPFMGGISVFAFLCGIFGITLGLGTGGLERLLYYPIFLWVIAFGAYLLSNNSTIHGT